MLRVNQLARLTCLLFVMAFARQTMGADLTIGTGTEPASLDPQYLWGNITSQLFYHYLGYMTRSGPDGKLEPSIGKSWRPPGANEWVFDLDPAAKFSNGTPVTAADVIASYERAINLPNGSYKGLFSPVQKFEAVDDRTLRIFTKKPYPVLPFILSQVPVIPKSNADSATSKDFMTPAANVSAAPTSSPNMFRAIDSY